MGTPDILCENESTKPIVQEEQNDDHQHFRRPDDWSRRLNSMPLVAALLAPLSTLLDIPAMTQRWYTENGLEISDPTANLALSGIGLALNVIANALLLARFSGRSQRFWAPATTASTICWFGKTVVAVVNVAVFGASRKNSSRYRYTEAFWSAVASVILAGIISILLVSHYCWAFRAKRDDKSVRNQGRRFMLSISILLFVIGIQALIYSFIEHWSYFDGIYFSVVTMLTIGFGDYVPTRVSTKIMLLPFSILTISQLANEVSMIVRYFSDRAQVRKDRWRAKVDTEMKERARRPNLDSSLKDEIELINKIAQKDQVMSECYDLIWSFSSLLVFWLAGAAIFSRIEGWTFWNAWYFEIVFSLTIGESSDDPVDPVCIETRANPLNPRLGDFSPKTPGGRVFFVIYAFSAVPLVASFAVQAVTGLLSTYFTSQAARYARHHGGQTLPPLDAFRSHQYFVLKQRDLILELGRTATIDDKDNALPRAELSDDEVTAVTRDNAAAVGINVDSSSEQGPLETWGMAQERVLTQELIECTMIMESIARRLIVESLPRNTIGRTLLEADHNLQCRNVQAAGGDTDILFDLGKSKLGARPKVNSPEQQQYEGSSQLDQIRRYREMFARILATGSALQRLEGEERYRFERVMVEERARARSAGGSSCVAFGSEC